MSSLRPPRPRGGTQSSVHGSQHSTASNSSRPKLKRAISSFYTFSMKQREVMAFSEFKDTVSLVSCFNETMDATEKEVLKHVFFSYVEFFENEDTVSTVSYWNAYLELGNIQYRKQDNMNDFWLKWLKSIVMKIDWVTHIAIESLEIALQRMPCEVFKGNLMPLTEIANTLFGLLTPDTSALVKQNFSGLNPTLAALHQVFILIKEVTRTGFLNENQMLFKSITAKLKAIKKDQTYYPIYYLTCQVEQAFLCLEKDELMSKVWGYFWRTISGVKAAINIWNFYIKVVEMEIDLKLLDSVIKDMQHCIGADRAWKKKWHNRIKYLNTLALRGSFDENSLNEYFQEVKDVWSENPSGAAGTDNSKMVQYATIMQLRLLINQSRNDRVQKKILGWILTFAEQYKLQGFACDKDICEALLNTLRDTYARVKDQEKEDIAAACETMMDTDVDVLKQFYGEWLGGQNLKEKLDSSDDKKECFDDDVFFEEIKKNMNVFTHEEIKARKKELKDRYSDEEFATVPFAYDKKRKLYLNSLEFFLKKCEKIDDCKVQQNTVGQSCASDDDKLQQQHKPEPTVTKPMNLQDLFAKPPPEEGNDFKDINTILLHGLPGTGKSLALKTLAYLWSVGQWGENFEFVFLLHVKDLKEKEFDGGEVKKEPSLATAIAKLCFNHRETQEFILLRTYIQDKLKERTTLLMIDGLDECHCARTEIMKEAKRCRCRLLLSSRSFDIKEEKDNVDYEVEVAGFSEEQLESFISRELEDYDPLELISILKKNERMWKWMHVPLKASPTCFLWKNDKEAMKQNCTYRGLNALYKQLMRHMWSHSISNPHQRQNENQVFECLGKLAAVCLKRNNPSIDIVTMDDCARDDLKQVLLDSGLLYKAEDNKFYFTQSGCQEYFTAQHLGRSVCGSDNREKEVAQVFLREKKYSYRFKVVMRFLVEELSEKGDITFDELTKIIDEDPKYILDWNHLLFKVWILDGWLIGTKDLTIRYLQQNSKSANEIVKQITEIVTRTSNDIFMLGLIHDKMKLCDEVMRQLPDLKNEILQKLQISERNHCETVRTTEKPDDKKQRNEVVCNIFEDNYGKLEQMARHEDFSIRQSAAKEASELARRHSLNYRKIAPLVIPLMEDENPAVRHSACQQASALATSVSVVAEQVGECIIALLKDKDLEVRAAAIEEATKIAVSQNEISVGLTNAVMESMDAQEWQIREAAVGQASSLVKNFPDMQKKVVSKIMQKMTDPDWHVRKATVEQALQLAEDHPIDRDDLFKGIVELMTDKEWQVRQCAVRQLPRLKESSDHISESIVRLLLQLMDDPDLRVCGAAADQVAELADGLEPYQSREIFERIVELNKHKEREVCEAARKAFKKIVSKLSPKDLKPLIRDIVNIQEPKDLLRESSDGGTLLSIPAKHLIELALAGNCPKATAFCAFYFLKFPAIFRPKGQSSDDERPTFEVLDIKEVVSLETSEKSAVKFIKEINQYLDKAY